MGKFVIAVLWRLSLYLCKAVAGRSVTAVVLCRLSLYVSLYVCRTVVGMAAGHTSVHWSAKRPDS